MTRTATYPRISTDGAMLALRLKSGGYLEPNPLAGPPPREHPSTWNPERLAHECSALVTLARRHTSLMVRACNEQTDDAHARKVARLRERIRESVEALVPKVRRSGMELEFSGDPRGRTVTIRWDSFTTWGLA